MIIVIHNVQLEPITVIDLPSEAFTKLCEHGIVKVALSGDIENGTPRYVNIAKLDIGPPEEKNGCIYVVDNEEIALAFKPHWLPGQQILINCYQEIIKKLQESR